MIELVLILEDNDTKYFHICSSTADLEDVLAEEDLTKYCYTNIIFNIDSEWNPELSKLYKNRYLNNKKNE